MLYLVYVDKTKTYMETNKNDTPSMDDVNDILPLFGVKALRSSQKDVIKSLLFEDNDLLAILPTGGGKTLCFQVASYYQKALTIIIYPLLSLMRDQKKRFENSTSKAVILQGGQTKKERNEIFEQIHKRDAKIIITNPETLRSKRIVEFLKKEGVSLFVIDEAHTVVEWGESFREAYKELRNIIENLTPAKIAAFTATSSIYVTNKLNEYVFFKKTPKIIRLSSNRENINYHKVLTLSRTESLKQILRICSYPVLIFTSTRNEAKNTARLLSEIQDHPIRFYHAGLTKEEKLGIEKWYYNSSDGILASTCAFGMGVDKGNIRTVIHLKPPQNPSAFLQESGRAGRDGETSDSYVIVKRSDLFLRNGNKNTCAEIFLNDKKDIRKSLLEEMGENTDDFVPSKNDTPFITMQDEKEAILKEVSLNRGYYTAKTLSQMLKKKGTSFKNSESDFKKWSDKSATEAIMTLVNDKSLVAIKEQLYPKKLTVGEQIVKKFTILEEKGKCKLSVVKARLKNYCTRILKKLKLQKHIV